MPDLLENIKDFFTDLFTPGPETTNYWSFYKNLSRWKKDDIFPSQYELTELIELPNNFWNEVVNVYKETKNDGHERSLSVFWGDGELYLSSVTIGTEKSVMPKGNIYIQYLPTSRSDYFRKEVFLDNKLHSKEDVYYKKVPKEIVVSNLFNMHSHPPSSIERWMNNDQTKIQKESYGNIYVGKQVFYSFFSLQDLKALFNTKTPITGLVTDRLWIIIRTNQSSNLTDQMTDADVNIESITQKLKLVVYQGEFRKKLVKL